MKTKLFLTSVVAMGVVAPAFATPTNTSATFPANGYMLEDYTYTNAATSTNMAGVYEDEVNADANYDDCPVNSWCDASGQHACSSLSGSYTLSAAGSTANTDCYKACTVATANIAHAATVTGNDYYGAGTDTCSAATCENGYHILGVVGGSYISNSGTNTASPTNYELTENGTFALEYADNRGVIKGHAQCSSRAGNANTWVNNMYNFFEDNVTSTLPDSSGQYCYCALDSYTPVDGSAVALSGPWVFRTDKGSSSNCADFCVSECFMGLYRTSSFRVAILGSLNTTITTCEANTITINWSNASAADIAANEAGTVTYGGDIRTPVAAEHIPGKIFVGWTFSAPEPEED